MNMTSIFIIRLLKFSKHLDAIESHPRQGKITIVQLRTYLSNFKLVYDVGIPGWLTEELTNCFPEFWHFNARRKEYSLIGDIPDEAPSEAGAGTTFNLSEREFLHVFSLFGGFHSPDIYGGRKLTETSTPKDIAKNLLDLAAYRISQTNLN